MAKKTPPARRWTPRDSALWHTCEIAADLGSGRPPQPKLEVLTPFPPQLADDELIWAGGAFQLLEQAAPGDGSYVHNGGFFFATGPAGLAATAAVALGTAAGNSARRKAAAAQAVPRWMPTDGGQLYLSRHGFYFSTAKGLHTWIWAAITMSRMVGAGAVHIVGQSDRGPVSWVLRSDWAELLFVTWALEVHPRHPQLLTGEWLPPGWPAWAAAHHPTRLATPVIAAGG